MSGRRFCRSTEAGVVGIGSEGGAGVRVWTELRRVVVLEMGNGGGERETERINVFAKQIHRFVFGKGLDELFGVADQLIFPEAQV